MPVFITVRRESGKAISESTSISISPFGVLVFMLLTVCRACTASIFALPPTKSWIFFARARPAALPAVGAAGAAAAEPAAAPDFAPAAGGGFAPGPGVGMSIRVGGPIHEGGLLEFLPLAPPQDGWRIRGAPCFCRHALQVLGGG